jgi:PD-(D/E)XK nuclease superfamily
MLDNQTKHFFFNERSEEMAEGLRPGRVAFGDRWVRSRPLPVPGHDTKVTLQGKIDTALAYDDGSFGIVDFKTSEPKAGHVPFYGRQLHSYALASNGPVNFESRSRIKKRTPCRLLHERRSRIDFRDADLNLEVCISTSEVPSNLWMR